MLKHLLRNLFPHRGLVVVAVAAFFAAGCSDDTKEPSGYGPDEVVAPETEIFISEATSAAQNKVIDDPKTALPITVTLGKALSSDVSFTLEADAEWVDNYNAAHGTDWQLLPEADLELTVKKTIYAGATTTAEPVNLKVTLPSDANVRTYVLPVKLADVFGAASIRESQRHLVYLLAKGNFVYFGQAANSGETSYKIPGDQPVTLPLDVEITDPVSSDLTVALKVDQSVVSKYNAQNGTSYQVLPANCYTWAANGKVTIAAGNTSASAALEVKSLPEGKELYAIGFSLESVSGADNVSVKDGQSEWIYLLRRNTSPAIQKSAVITGFTAASQTAATLNLGTYSTWTIEYWLRYDDISSYKSQYNVDTDWLSGDSGQGNWRRSVCSPQNVPVGLPSPMDFNFWPQADQPVGPQFQLTQSAVMSATTANGGYDWRPDTWAHLVFTYDGENVRYYINGKSQKFGGNTSSGAQDLTGETVQYSGATSWNSIAFVNAGGNATYVTTLQIEMAQMRLWNRVLEESEIAENMGLILDADAVEGLVGYWKMDEGSGTTLYDSSGKGNDITSSYIKWSESTYDFSTNNGN